MRPSARHIPALDGLRAIAILLVILAHSNVSFGGPFLSGSSGIVSRTLGAGWVGVDLFFVLSGFLITGILVDSAGDRGYFQNFYARRILRILPLYFAFIMAALFLWRTLGYAVASETSASLLLYYYNLYTAWTSRTAPFAHHFWSLAVEEHFYFVWPFVVFFCRRRTVLICICLAGACGSLLCRIAILAAGQSVQTAYLITPCRLDGLLIGAAVAIAVRDTVPLVFLRKLARMLLCTGTAVVAAIVFAVGHFSDGVEPGGSLTDSRPIVTLGITSLSIAFGAIVFMVQDSGPRWLCARPLRLVGKYSYGMYVFHLVFVSGLTRLLSRIFPTLPPVAGKLILAGLVAVTSYACAMASYHVFEERFLRLKRRFEYSTPEAPRTRQAEAGTTT